LVRPLKRKDLEAAPAGPQKKNLLAIGKKLKTLVQQKGTGGGLRHSRRGIVQCDRPKSRVFIHEKEGGIEI